MTIRCIAAGTLALCSTAVLAVAQAPQNSIRPAAPRPASQLAYPVEPEALVLTATSGQTTTVLVGCLYREIQVTGNPGTYDDYILADVTTPATGQPRPGATPGATGTSGIVPTTGNMYEVENVRDFRLEGFVGMRVELTGTIDANGSGRSDQTDLPEFEARAIRAVAGTCPPTPAPRK
jgi:hypothetical protein